MTKKIVILFLLCNSIFVFSQLDGYKRISCVEADSLGHIKGRDFNIGLGVGFARPFQKLTVVDRIAINNYEPSIKEVTRATFLSSFTISLPILSNAFGGKYYRKLDSEGNPVGYPQFVHRGLSVIGSLNLFTYHANLGAGGAFSKWPDGGFGLAYSFDHHLQLAFTFDWISYKQIGKNVNMDDYVSHTFVNPVTKVTTTIPPAKGIISEAEYTHLYMPALSIRLVYALRQ